MPEPDKRVALVAREVKDSNIMVNSVGPGWVRTDMGGTQAPLSALRLRGG